jgi:hypothetical protein
LWSTVSSLCFRRAMRDIRYRMDRRSDETMAVQICLKSVWLSKVNNKRFYTFWWRRRIIVLE